MVTARRELHPLHSISAFAAIARLLLESLTVTNINITSLGSEVKEEFYEQACIVNFGSPSVF